MRSPRWSQAPRPRSGFQVAAGSLPAEASDSGRRMESVASTVNPMAAMEACGEGRASTAFPDRALHETPSGGRHPPVIHHFTLKVAAGAPTAFRIVLLTKRRPGAGIHLSFTISRSRWPRAPRPRSGSCSARNAVRGATATSEETHCTPSEKPAVDVHFNLLCSARSGARTQVATWRLISCSEPIARFSPSHRFVAVVRAFMAAATATFQGTNFPSR